MVTVRLVLVPFQAVVKPLILGILNIANCACSFASRVRFPLDTLKEEAMQSLVSSLPVVKRTIAALAARVKQFEGAVEVGTEVCMRVCCI